MKIKTIHIIIGTVFLTFFVFPGITYAGLFKCVRVSDGDTITVVGHDIKIKVRLAGIDAPETSK